MRKSPQRPCVQSPNGVIGSLHIRHRVPPHPFAQHPHASQAGDVIVNLSRQTRRQRPWISVHSYFPNRSPWVGRPSSIHFSFLHGSCPPLRSALSQSLFVCSHSKLQKTRLWLRKLPWKMQRVSTTFMR
jgi:hypothetical protein